MTKYSDLEPQDGDDRDTTNVIKEPGYKQKTCWWCLIICPIVIAIGICVFLTLFIRNQFEERDAIDDKVIVIFST